MLDRARSYARTHWPESALLRAAAALVALFWLAPLDVASARAGEHLLYVRLPADMPAATSRRLVSALEAQLADLAPIDLTEPNAERALGIVAIAEAAGALSIQFADARAGAIGPPRLVSGAEGELGASEVASIVRAFVVARLDRAPPAPLAPPDAPPLALNAAPTPAPDAAEAVASPSVARRPPVADRPAPAPSETWRLRLAAAYSGTTYAPQLRWQDGLRVDASARLKGPLYAGASYGYQVPAEVADSETAVRIRVGAHTLNAFAGLGRTWRRLGVALDAGLGAAKTLRSTTHVTPALERTPETSQWNLVATLRLHGRLRFPAAPRFGLDVAPALELAPGLGKALVATPSGEESLVLSPSSWRARVDVGAAFDVF